MALSKAQKKRAAAAADAWQAGVSHAQAGDFAAARNWLERAHRLAPNDPRLTLDLANLRLAMGDPAEALFETLAARFDAAPAWEGLIQARRAAGDLAGARAALATYLSRHCVTEAAASLADSVAGPQGWHGAMADGRIAGSGKRVRGHAGLDFAALVRVVGIVGIAADGLAGWASRPAAPAAAPALNLVDAKGTALPVPFTGTILPADDDAPLATRHEFMVSAADLRGLSPPLRVCTTAGDDIFGSPLDPAALKAITPVPAKKRGARVTALPAHRTLAIVIPVYRGLAMTQACLESVFAALPPRGKIIVVDDATPEPPLAAWLDGLAAQNRITLIRHARNLGFPAAVNAGMRAAGRRDVLLLNSDTLVPPGAIAALADAAYQRAEIGSVTPLSNEATICSYPDGKGGNPPPDLAGTTRMNELAGQANPGRLVEIPTAVGFCMFMRHDAVAATGRLRANIFAQGYGEENDWCLRARHLGYVHVAATGVFVAHLGGASFGPAGRALSARNGGLLNRLYPGYDTLVGDFIRADRLTAARRRIDFARFAAGRRKNGAVLLISHSHGGGVARRVAAEMAAIAAAGQRPILLVPAAPADPETMFFPWDTSMTDGEPADYPNLIFTSREFDRLLRLLRQEDVQRVIFHHGLGHHAAVRDIAGILGVPQEIVIHDYASFCPRVNLLTRSSKTGDLRYCGEPDVAGCMTCVKIAGDETFERLGVKRLLARSAREFAAAARITAPSADTARRIARHFPNVTPLIAPWEDDSAPFTLRRPRREGRRNIIVIGGIGPQKGFDVLLACARDAAARSLGLSFIVAGTSAEDQRLLDGGVFVTGAYDEGEATGLIAGLNGDLAFLPSIWPETWCFTLTEAWRAGLYAITYDLGAQAARIRATGRGAVLPLGLPAPRINDYLLAWQPDLGN
jgi:GT2 family glycosyltransferase/glycosyltransferase involved in cell wall biosynthesis